MKETIVGLDIGGANLKAATSDGWATTHPFELWKHPEKLGAELRLLLEGKSVSRLAITMTGELCDCFETKREGVGTILEQVEAAFPGTAFAVWSTRGVFLAMAQARSRSRDVAAANWHALATWIGKNRSRLSWTGDAIMLDIGSTTSDLITIVDGLPATRGITDVERLEQHELVYTGVRRTPICAIIPRVMAEWFATTLDAYLLMGFIGEYETDLNTADGRPATRRHAHARLARMLGGDAEMIRLDEVEELAREVFAGQHSKVASAFDWVRSRMSKPPETIFLSGSGEFLGRAVCATQVEDTKIVSLNYALGPAISSAACAYALAQLAETTWVK